jgi:hypothetical protein
MYAYHKSLYKISVNICYKSSHFPSSNGDKTKIRTNKKGKKVYILLGRIHLTHGSPADSVCHDGLVAGQIREGNNQTRDVSGSKSTD